MIKMKKPLISSDLVALIETLLNKELYAMYFYLNAANAMQAIGYFGCQAFFTSESENERTHYQRIVNYLNDVGVKPNLVAISAPSDIRDIKQAFAQAFELEYSLCKDYKSAAQSALTKDSGVFTFLQEFVTEQRKSVGEYGDLIAKLELCGNNEAALLEFDEHINE